MQTGKLDQTIELLSLTEVNSGGELTRDYVSEGKVFAHVKTQHGWEAMEAARTNAKQTIRVLLRFRADVNIKWKIIWEEQDYNIVAIDRSNRRQGELWLTCQVVGAK